MCPQVRVSGFRVYRSVEALVCPKVVEPRKIHSVSSVYYPPKQPQTLTVHANDSDSVTTSFDLIMKPNDLQMRKNRKKATRDTNAAQIVSSKCLGRNLPKARV